MVTYAREPETDPALHWVTQHRYGWDGDLPTKDPIPIAEQIEATRSDLNAGHETDLTPPWPLHTVDMLVLANVLEECAARLRLAGEAGHPAGQPAVADFADELADRLLRIVGLRGA